MFEEQAVKQAMAEWKPPEAEKGKKKKKEEKEVDSRLEMPCCPSLEAVFIPFFS